ncbi:MAG: type II toxin-antitoxin system RelE/ParE family toxin [Candidatus Pacearchaeota archaeon]|jgi:mRNA-degrading endonuclease RelE of RelBE toxin-antitoxin system
MSDVRFAPDANSIYLKLKKSKDKIDQSIFNSINEKIEQLKQNPKIGEPLQKKFIPEKYIQKHGIKNLFKIRLTNYWRLLYTLSNNNEINVLIFIVDIIDHDEYNDIFGFKKK